MKAGNCGKNRQLRKRHEIVERAEKYGKNGKCGKNRGMKPILGIVKT